MGRPLDRLALTWAMGRTSSSIPSLRAFYAAGGLRNATPDELLAPAPLAEFALLGLTFFAWHAGCHRSLAAADPIIFRRSIYSQQNDTPGHHSPPWPLDLVSTSDFTECRFNSGHGIAPRVDGSPLGRLTTGFRCKARCRTGARAVEGVKWRQSFPQKFRTCSRPASRFMDAMAPDYQTLFPAAGRLKQ